MPDCCSIAPYCLASLHFCLACFWKRQMLITQLCLVKGTHVRIFEKIGRIVLAVSATIKRGVDSSYNFRRMKKLAHSLGICTLKHISQTQTIVS